MEVRERALRVSSSWAAFLPCPLVCLHHRIIEQDGDAHFTFKQAFDILRPAILAKETLIYSSLMKQLAIRLSQQAGKSLVIRRRPESSVLIKKSFRFLGNVQTE